MATPKKAEGAVRQHEHQFDIAASAEAVWKAITDAAELVNWFPFEAEVEPGEGGSVTYGWGEFRGACRIHTWAPAKHLRTSWLTAVDPGDEFSAQIAVDWFLEGEHGRTRLRLVHSGFGPGHEWDEEFDGTNRGWDFELRALKHYMEKHHGRTRSTLWVRRPVPLPAAEVWQRLVAPAGLVQLTDPARLRAGDPVRLALASGDRVEGEMVQYLPPTDISFSARNMNDGLIRVAYEKCFGEPEAQVWVSLWDYPEDQAAALKQRLEVALTQVLT